MQDRLMSMGGGAARAVLVIAAFLLAVGSIGLTIVRPFCPEGVPSAATTEAPSDGATEPADGDATEAADADATEAADAPVATGPCAGGQPRCLPPMIAGILETGDDVCHDQAASRMRGTLLPALVVSVVMLAGAWALRPRDGGRVISRW